MSHCKRAPTHSRESSTNLDMLGTYCISSLLNSLCSLQDDYKIGLQHMTYLPSLYGPSNMKFNGKDHFIVDPNEQRWYQTILKRCTFVFLSFSDASTHSIL
jgi:hypothetical protein